MTGMATVTTAAPRAEAERQLAAAIERHREAVTAMQESGRPEAGQHVAIKVVGRAVHLVSFALKRAASAGVPFERLVELTGWEPDLVREGLERDLAASHVVARLAPAGIDALAVAQAAAGFEAIRCLRRLTEAVLADVDPIDHDARSPLTSTDVEDLRDRLEAAWRSWREQLPTAAM